MFECYVVNADTYTSLSFENSLCSKTSRKRYFLPTYWNIMFVEAETRVPISPVLGMFDYIFFQKYLFFGNSWSDVYQWRLDTTKFECYVVNADTYTSLSFENSLCSKTSRKRYFLLTYWNIMFLEAETRVPIFSCSTHVWLNFFPKICIFSISRSDAYQWRLGTTMFECYVVNADTYTSLSFANSLCSKTSRKRYLLPTYWNIILQHSIFLYITCEMLLFLHIVTFSFFISLKCWRQKMFFKSIYKVKAFWWWGADSSASFVGVGKCEFKNGYLRYSMTNLISLISLNFNCNRSYKH